MLDSLGGRQQSSPWFDNLSSAVNSNSSVSSGSPPSLSSHLGNSDVLSRPSWLFSSQVSLSPGIHEYGNRFCFLLAAHTDISTMNEGRHLISANVRLV
ncbi:hypothetical protein NECAME_08576 [Necator americanus]|uniref:Uncharacterized protein n=1 Tax=Necator americanus TaxID=51031 RepID=W2TIC5_NECAM|nr:hypothetical protein NECAME_08576 [Necator americanus]ETN81319.1 hypothetical protein NECAME_08576 [Necator americanus]